MTKRLYTWAMTFGWPPGWPLARLWATQGDPDVTIRRNAETLHSQNTLISALKDENRRLKKGGA